MRQTRTTWWATLGVGLALGLSGCGGAATTEPATEAPGAGASATPAATAGSASGAPPASDAPAASAADIGPLNVAVVTIGDQRYAFTEVECAIFTARYIQAGNFGADPEVKIVLPPEGWESQGDTFGPPSVQVTVGDEFSGGMIWLAGDNGSPTVTPIPPGSSQIDSYTVPDGRPVKATGTATFIDLAAHRVGRDAPSVSGTFEVSCP